MFFLSREGKTRFSNSPLILFFNYLTLVVDTGAVIFMYELCSLWIISLHENCPVNLKMCCSSIKKKSKPIVWFKCCEMLVFLHSLGFVCSLSQKLAILPGSLCNDSRCWCLFVCISFKKKRVKQHKNQVDLLHLLQHIFDNM